MKTNIKKTIKLFIIILVTFSMTGIVSAQTSSDVIITWEAENFYPANYQHKASVTRNSPVTVGVELIENNRLVNLSQSLITWYLDGKLFKRDNGIDEIQFTASKLKGGEHKIRVVIERPGGNRDKTINIPVSGYDLALSHNGVNAIIPSGSSVTFTAIPYFFNISSMSDLSFVWSVNNQVRTNENSNRITVNVDGNEELLGTSFLVGSVVSSVNDQIESARITKSFEIR